MMGLFDALYRGKSRGKTHYLSSWKMHVEGSHHYFTDKLLKPFSEDKLNEVRFHINDLICARCNEVYVIVHPNDKLIDPTNVEYLRKACIRNNVKFSCSSVPGKHATFSVLRPKEFKKIVFE